MYELDNPNNDLYLDFLRRKALAQKEEEIDLVPFPDRPARFVYYERPRKLNWLAITWMVTIAALTLELLYL